MNPIPTSEEEIIARICSGEKSLFHDLIRRYARIMFGYADAILRNPADSEEAVQEAALKVYLNPSKLEDHSRFRSWLLQIVVNEARMYRRQLYDSIEDADGENESDSIPRQFADWHELRMKLWTGLNLGLLSGMQSQSCRRYIARCWS